jgi:PKD repeat protein
VAVLALVLAVLLGPSIAPGSVAQSAVPTGPFQTGPTADLVVSPNPANPGEVVTLDARNSSTTDGSIARCEFDLNGDGVYTESAQDCLLETSFDALGEYPLSVRVTTTTDRTATASERLAVVENDPPTAVIVADPTNAGVGDVVTLSGRESTDADGAITTYNWELPTSRFTGEAVETSFDEPGEYAVTLTVIDDDGAEASTTETILVEETNDSPTARLSAVAADPTVGDPIELDASESADPDGTIDAYAWDFDGDGSVDRTTAEPSTGYVPESPGSLSIQVTVIDDAGAADTATVEFRVAAARTATAVPTPTARAGTPIPETATPPPGTVTPTPATVAGASWADWLDLGVLPVVPDLLAVLVLLVVLLGGVTAVKSHRRQAVADQAGRLRDLVLRGDVRRRVANKGSRTAVKAAAKKVIRKLSDLIEGGGKGIGEVFERIGRAIKRTSERVANWLRSLGA